MPVFIQRGERLIRECEGKQANVLKFRQYLLHLHFSAQRLSERIGETVEMVKVENVLTKG